MTEHYDIIIVGTGAGGGTLARALAPTGKRILILERGGCAFTAPLGRPPTGGSTGSLKYSTRPNWFTPAPN